MHHTRTQQTRLLRVSTACNSNHAIDLRPRDLHNQKYESRGPEQQLGRTSPWRMRCAGSGIEMVHLLIRILHYVVRLASLSEEVACCNTQSSGAVDGRFVSSSWLLVVLQRAHAHCGKALKQRTKACMVPRRRWRRKKKALSHGGRG